MSAGGADGRPVTVGSSFLFKKLKALEAAAAEGKLPPPSGAGGDDAGAVTFTLFHGASAAERKAVRMEELNGRLAHLERVILGSGSDETGAPAGAAEEAKADEEKEYAKPGSLDVSGAMAGVSDTRKGMLGNVEMLWRRLDLLTDSGRLKQLQRRAETLKRNLDDISLDTKGVAEDEITKSKEKKIDDMFDTLQRWDALNVQEVLPKVIDRLKALQVLHGESADVFDKVEALATQQELIKGTLSDNKKLLETVSKSLGENAKLMADNLDSIEKRMAALQSKLK
jgi:hypothetical protein